MDYQVRQIGEIQNQMAFALNKDNASIVIAKSGHATIAKYTEAHCGGYIWLKECKMTINSGYLGSIPDKDIRDAWKVLCNHFKIDFRIIK